MATITCCIPPESLLENILRFAREAVQGGGDLAFAHGVVFGRLSMLENLFHGYDECKLQAVINETKFLFDRRH